MESYIKIYDSGTQLVVVQEVDPDKDDISKVGDDSDKEEDDAFGGFEQLTNKPVDDILYGFVDN